MTRGCHVRFREQPGGGGKFVGGTAAGVFVPGGAKGGGVWGGWWEVGE